MVVHTKQFPLLNTYPLQILTNLRETVDKLSTSLRFCGGHSRPTELASDCVVTGMYVWSWEYRLAILKI